MSLRIRLYDKPPASAGKLPANCTVMFRHKNTAAGGEDAITRWAASGSSHLHIQNLGSTRSEYSILDQDGYARCVQWLTEAYNAWDRLIDSRQHQLDAVSLDDLFDRRARDSVASRLWQAFYASKWMPAVTSGGISIGAYGHIAFGTVASPVVWMLQESEARDVLQQIEPASRGWPWVVGPGIQTASGIWTPDRFRARLRTCRDMGCPVVLCWTGGANSGVAWPALFEVAKEFV